MTDKYTTENLIPALRLFVEARRAALTAGFTDNGGAIHSAERIAMILSNTVRYPTLSHPNSAKISDAVEITVAAHKEREAGNIGNVHIEHVMPHRAYTRSLCNLIEAGATDHELIDQIKATYRLVALTKEERAALDAKNRSKMTPDRIAEAELR